MTGSVSYFLSSPSIGSHDLKGGVVWFRSTNTGGNSQTSTGYVFEADYLTDDDGAPVVDSQGRFIPVFVPGFSKLQQWLPTRGARINIDTTSFYLHDRLTAGKHWSFDAGLRYGPGQWPGLDAVRYVPWAPDRPIIVLPAAAHASLIDLILDNPPHTAVEIGGRPWSVWCQPIFPSESIWMRAFQDDPAD